MKTKHLFYAATAIFLFVQSCKKTETSIPTKSTELNSVKKTASGTVAYQDNTITNWFKRNTNSLGSVAYDQAFSVPLSNGKVLWLFGDTYYKDLNADGTTPCLFNYHNSVLQQPSKTNWTQSSTTNLLYATSPQIYSDFSPMYFWPATGIEIGTKVYTYLTEMNGTTYVGGKLGILNEADNSVDYTTMTLPNLNGINFGNGMFKVGTTVYVYGTKLMDGYGTTRVYVAKFSTSGGSITFWNGGTSWLSTPPNPATTTNGIVVTTNSNALNVSYINGKYVMITTQFLYNCDGGTHIFGATSTSPTSGFTNINTNVIYDIPDKKLGSDGLYHTPVFYTPIIHPEFTASNEFLFTYCINNYDNSVHSCHIPACVSGKATPDDYRPRAVRVPYVVLGL